MNREKFGLLASILVFILSLTLLLTGAPLLEIKILKDPYLPVGTLTTWLGMISLPCAIYWGIKELRRPTTLVNQYLSRLLKLCIVLTLVWAPVCALLAGNLAFNFSEAESFQGGQSAMRWFWRYSYGLPIASLVLLFAFGLLSIFSRLQRNS